MNHRVETPRLHTLGLLTALTALWVLSCVPEVDDSWRHPLGDEIDILMVLDNSNSMARIQEELQIAFPQLLGALNESGLDWQLGITTTDTDHDGNGGSGNVRSSEPIAVDGCGPQLVVSEMEEEEATDLLVDLVDVGVAGSTDEFGLLSTALALCKGQSQAFWDGLSGLPDDDPVKRVCSLVPVEQQLCNAGVFREDATTLVVIVSDEGDSSSASMSMPPALELQDCVVENNDDPLIGECECRLSWWREFFDGIGPDVVFVTSGPSYQLGSEDTLLCDGSTASIPGPCNPFGGNPCAIGFYQEIACHTGGRFFPTEQTLVEDDPATCELADFGVIRDWIRDLLVGVEPDEK